jgi:hypothetical protein
MRIMIVPDRELRSIGKGLTWMWRHCCLEKMADAFAMKDEKGSKIVVTKYQWCLTRDVGNMTIAGWKGSMIRLGGLMFSQLYMTNKRLYEAAKHFPWDDGDDTMAVMALDLTYREALRATMGSKAVDDEMCRRSYNHSGRRYLMASRLNNNRSCPPREEHRMSLALFDALIDEWNRRGNPELRPAEDRVQFYVHPTRVVNEFSEAVTLPIASWYQTTLGMGPGGTLGIDRQKLAVMQSFLLKAAWGNSDLSRSPLLWAKKHRGEDNRETRVGLGLKDTIERFGFAWLPNDLFNWKENNFADGVADQFPFPIRQLENRYRKRKRERKLMMDVLQEMDQITGRINILGTCTRDEARRSKLLKWTATRVMLQYHLDVWIGLYKYSFLFKGKESERARQREVDEDEDSDTESEYEGGRRHGHRAKRRRLTTIKNANVVKKTFDHPPGLTYASVKAELEEEPIPVGMGKQYANRRELFHLIFESKYEDIKKGQSWKDKPYFQCLTRLEERLERKDYIFVMQRLWHLFTTNCHCVPIISRDRWLERAGRDKDKPGWIAFDPNGWRLDCSSSKWGVALQEGSSWLETRSMEEDKYWNVKIEDILAES